MKAYQIWVNCSTDVWSYTGPVEDPSIYLDKGRAEDECLQLMGLPSYQETYPEHNLYVQELNVIE